MKKNTLKPTTEIRLIPGTQYILLPDNKVARLLTPTVRPSGDNYNLRIDGRTRQFALLLLLDGYPYVEMTARKSADFMTDLNAWKRKTYPSLSRSNVRFFTLAPTGEVKELTFTK